MAKKRKGGLVKPLVRAVPPQAPSSLGKKRRRRHEHHGSTGVPPARPSTGGSPQSGRPSPGNRARDGRNAPRSAGGISPPGADGSPSIARSQKKPPPGGASPPTTSATRARNAPASSKKGGGSSSSSASRWRGMQNQRVYRQAATALTRLLAADRTKQGGASLKSLTLAPENVAKRATHALTCETLRHLPLLQQLLRAVGLVAPAQETTSNAASTSSRSGADGGAEAPAKAAKGRGKSQGGSSLWEELVYVVAYDSLFGNKQAVAAAARLVGSQSAGGGGGGSAGAEGGAKQPAGAAVLRAVLEQRSALQAALARLVVRQGASSVQDLLHRHFGILRGARSPSAQAGGSSSEQAPEGHPRYARVNTLKATVEEVMAQFQTPEAFTGKVPHKRKGGVLGAGFQDGGARALGKQPAEGSLVGKSQRERSSFSSDDEEEEEDSAGGGRGSSKDGKQRKAPTASEDMPGVQLDPLIPSVLQFPPGLDLHSHPLVLSGQLILQGRASCLPAAILRPSPGTHVLDACAAPGNKTTQLAALMGGAGRITACERDPKRACLLRETVSRAGAGGMVAVREGDFLGLDPGGEEARDVVAVLVDPSCSGSGTRGSRMDHLLPSFRRQQARKQPQQPLEPLDEKSMPKEQGEQGQGSEGGVEEAHEGEDQGPGEKRLERLARFQEVALRHALAFPQASRVVYSTCSVEERENEAVVARVLPKARELGFQLSPALPAWPRRGLGHYPFGPLVLRTDPGEDKMDGFFVALFTRESPGSGEAASLKPAKTLKRRKKA